MTRTTLRHGLVLLTAVGASLGLIGSASADGGVYPAVLKLAPGYGGPKEKNGGPGHEQIHAATFVKEGKQYVVSVYMSSNVDQNQDGYWQCKCTSTLMDPIVGPVIVQDQVQLTHNGGFRPCNHPRISTNGAELGVWTYGSNEANGNTRTYVQGINEKCELTSDRLRISEDNNQNEGAPHIEYINGDWFAAGYLSTANNDNDATHMVGLTATYDANGQASIQKMWNTKVVAPANIGRPAFVPAGQDRAFVCAAQGNNRPPEDGVACALVDTTNGQVLHKEIIAKSDEAAGIYFNQPTVARLSNDVFAVQVLESNGLGKKNNIKGSNTPHLYAFKVTADAFFQQAFVDKVGPYPTHSSICSGTYGEKGLTYVAVMGASPTGLGQPGIQFVKYENSSFKVDKFADNWTVGFYGDSGKLSNLYGPNPNQQGRDFPLCIGGIKNPGFGVKNGYMPTVETFFLAPHSGNNGVDPKNAGFISFVPGKVSAAITPQAPQEQPKAGITPPSGDTGGTDPGTGGSGGAGGSDGNQDTGGTDSSISVNSPRAGACSVPSSNGSAPADFAFVALGAVALLAARRRR